MEEQKYYTPAPEEFRLGLECEKFYPQGLDVFPTGWYSLKLDQWNIVSAIKFPRDYRVPYLTAEQIEAEGWVKYESGSGLVRYRKPFYSLVHSASTNHLNVTQYAEEDGEAFDLFNGTCRCINDFRLISKLLGI